MLLRQPAGAWSYRHYRNRLTTERRDRGGVMVLRDITGATCGRNSRALCAVDSINTQS